MEILNIFYCINLLNSKNEIDVCLDKSMCFSYKSDKFSHLGALTMSIAVEFQNNQKLSTPEEQNVNGPL